jgi:hypothetical protein
MAPKAKGISLNTPMTHPFPGPKPGGDLGVGLDFAAQPHEGISGHNIHDCAEAKGTHSGQTSQSKIETPAKIVNRVKVDE